MNKPKTRSKEQTKLLPSQPDAGIDRTQAVADYAALTSEERRDSIVLIRAALGYSTVLLPIKPYESEPLIKGWRDANGRTMLDPDYIQLLRENDVGVALGKTSGGVCVIQIAEAHAEAFLELNPRLRKTMQTTGSEGLKIWFRITGKYPRSQTLETWLNEPVGRWCADGYSIIRGLDAAGKQYRVTEWGETEHISFGEIVWPHVLKSPGSGTVHENLTREEGGVLSIDSKGVPRINLSYVVKYFVHCHSVAYDQRTDTFYVFDRDWQFLDVHSLKSGLAMQVNRLGESKNFTSMTQFQVDDPRIEEMISMLKARLRLPALE